MSKLFIIGNGFDCYGHGMPTKYSDFKRFLLDKYPDIMSIPPRIPSISTFYPLSEKMKLCAEVERVRYLLYVLDICQNDQWSNLEAILGDKIFETFIDDFLVDGYSPEPTLSFEYNEAKSDGFAEMTALLTQGIILEDTFDSLKEYFPALQEVHTIITLSKRIKISMQPRKRTLQRFLIRTKVSTDTVELRNNSKRKAIP